MSNTRSSCFQYVLHAPVLVINKRCLFQQNFTNCTHELVPKHPTLHTTTIQLMSMSVVTAAGVMESFYSDDKLFIQIRYTQPNTVLFENHVRAELRIIFSFALEQFWSAFILIHDDNSRKLRGGGGRNGSRIYICVLAIYLCPTHCRP